jgi:hypothetical protein
VYEVTSTLMMTTPFTDQEKNNYEEALTMTIPGLKAGDEVNVTKVIPIESSTNATSSAHGQLRLLSITGYDITWTLSVLSNTIGPSEVFTQTLSDALSNPETLMTALKSVNSASFANVTVTNVSLNPY